MTSADRRARARAALQEQILDAARELFATHGFEAVTLRKIAAAIEYAPAAIYGHFADKEALIRALCLRDFDQLNAEFARLLSVADPLQRIARAGQVFVRFACAHPNHFRLMFLQHVTLPEDEELRSRKGDPARDGYAFLVQAVGQALERGLLRAELRDAELVAQTFWAGVQGVASIEIAFQGDPWVPLRPLEARSTAAIDALLRGLARPGAWGGLAPARRLVKKRRGGAR
jgi:AcrR family transcriptional regulator